ncbi:MAG: actin-like protein arp8 [Phylliscum demangeonii]|nr:MAG: actin-like protein arp8 [Phylliscum demangeonii]
MHGQLKFIAKKTASNLDSILICNTNEYLKRDDQLLVFRLQAEESQVELDKAARDRDRSLAQANDNEEATVPAGDVDMEDDVPAEEADAPLEEHLGSKVIVIHLGSQNLRIGLASDALPKTVPMVIARKSHANEHEGTGDAKPKRLHGDRDLPLESEKLFGKEASCHARVDNLCFLLTLFQRQFADQFAGMVTDLKARMRANKRRMLPNSKELVVNFNKRTPPEAISEHNDPNRVEWTELLPAPSTAPDFFTGQAALRLPDYSKPRYKLNWPLQHGSYNERDYASARLLDEDIATILEESIKNQVGIKSKKAWGQYGCVFVIPDLYERRYVVSVMHMILRDFGFAKVCFIQESLAATFGAGYTSACVVDIGAQKTSICCVEEGMCIENSRVNLKYGGADVTEAFIKMLLFDNFPYAEINLRRRYDFLLAEDLKQKFCTMNDAEISVQLYEFHVRPPAQDTQKYAFKTYDEVILAPMGFFYPSVFDHSEKLQGRRRLVDRSYDLYDGSPNDPVSAAQESIYQSLGAGLGKIGDAAMAEANGDAADGVATNGLTTQSGLNRSNPQRAETATPQSSAAGSPVPDDNNTPQPGGLPTANVNSGAAASSNAINPVAAKIALAEEYDRILPIMPLDQAILTSIGHGTGANTQAGEVDERKTRDFIGGIMLVGGGAQIPGLHGLLEERLKELRPAFAKDVMIGGPPRELDPQVVIWKGGSVFGKLSGTNDSWISQMEFDRLGARVLPYKCMWVW